ncbi:DNA glycosylase [Candidatus Bathyarchaeota archaeon]|nr:DNA glycosylase [Candidatus Bathyarchaeota archaeon]
MKTSRIVPDPLNLITKIRYVRERLLDWYKENGRDYPWRKTRDPYEILIAEIMLCRTRADQVVPIYKDFIKRYPTIVSLSKANEEDIQKLTYSLGLHWRNKRFRDLARYVISKLDGKIPQEREELTRLPGVGEYVAGVFVSSAYNKKEWIVDTNVIRVFSRFFGFKVKGDGRRDKRIISLAQQYVDCENPRLSNFAIIDFAALICKKINPLHSRCFISEKCVYYKGGGQGTDDRTEEQ